MTLSEELNDTADGLDAENLLPVTAAVGWTFLFVIFAWSVWH